MKSPEYLRLLDRLSSGAFTLQHKGLGLIVKPIPDCDSDGVLDPRVLRIYQETTGDNPFKPIEKPEGTGPAVIDPATFPIAALRASMGWPNLDVTDGRVETKYISIPGPDGDLPLRLYSKSGGTVKPAIVFFHGGGFIGGTVQVVENPCKALAEKVGAVVVSVDYRLAPEHPFPAGLDDCFATIKWLYDHAETIGIDAGRIAVSGDSAGGNLAAVCAILDRDRRTGMIAAQVLIYPALNLAGVPIGDHEWKIDEYQIGEPHDLIVDVASALHGSEGLLQALYLQGHASDDPLVSPLYLEDATALSPVLIVGGEFDALRLEGEAYARKLNCAGVRTRLIRYKGMDHAFLDKIGIYPQTEDMMAEIAAWLGELWN